MDVAAVSREDVRHGGKGEEGRFVGETPPTVCSIPTFESSEEVAPRTLWYFCRGDARDGGKERKEE